MLKNLFLFWEPFVFWGSRLFRYAYTSVIFHHISLLNTHAQRERERDIYIYNTHFSVEVVLPVLGGSTFAIFPSIAFVEGLAPRIRAGILHHHVPCSWRRHHLDPFGPSPSSTCQASRRWYSSWAVQGCHKWLQDFVWDCEPAVKAPILFTSKLHSLSSITWTPPMYLAVLFEVFESLSGKRSWLSSKYVISSSSLR